MKPAFYSSKEEIRNRIIKNAEDFWNVKDSSDLDPLVKLILEVLSNELFNISNDVKSLENRIFDKISRILAPDHLTAALPAHAILYAKAIEKSDYISAFTQFSFKKNIVKDDVKGQAKKTDIFFSPISRLKIHDAQIQYVATGNALLSIAGQSRSTFLNTLPGFSLPENTIYIGLKGFKDASELSNLNFFFDWKNYAIPEQSYELLSLTKWSIAEAPIATFTERFITETAGANENGPFKNKQLLNLIKADVLQYYSNRFITLGDVEVTSVEQANSYPTAFDSVFQPASLNRLGEGVIWLKVVFPAAITQDMLNELQIHINAFPVVNKRLSQIKHRLKIMSNIIPIKTENIEQILAVESLKDNSGVNYNEIPYTNEDEKGDGSYAIRYGGTERFDDRNAKDLVDYLFELLRDEKAAFSAYGPDFLSTALKNLEQNITLIEQKSRLALRDIKELPSYIVVKPAGNADLVFLDLWVTQAEDANRINAGSKLVLQETNNKIDAESILLLTQSKGGRSRLNSTNKVQAYKYGLTTADRIITKADIINFCKYELGAKVIGVTLTKGLMMSSNPNGGFTKTTDIIIEPNNQINLSQQDWEELLDITLAKLKLRSSINITYRMLLKQAVYK